MGSEFQLNKFQVSLKGPHSKKTTTNKKIRVKMSILLTPNHSNLIIDS